MKKDIELTILIPALNEEETIEIVVKKAKKWIEEHNVEGEILVVNNGSTDKTKEIALKTGARVIDIKKRGYGIALVNGIKEALGKYVIFGDADDSYNFLELDKFWERLESGCDIVIGNRYGGKTEKGAIKFLHRYIGTPVLSYIVRKRFKINIKDINCGLRGVRKERFLELGCKEEGMEFASEMIIKATKKKINIIEVPINFYKDKRNRTSHLRTIKDGIRHLRLILKS